MGICASAHHDKTLVESLDFTPGKHGVFLVPGMCSNALEVKLASGEEHEVIYLDVEKILGDGRELFHELELRVVSSKLKNGQPTNEVVEKTPGVSVRPVDGLSACAFLDPHSPIPIAPLWMPLIKKICSGCNLSCISYDWRKWGSLKYAEETLDLFREGVEELVKECDGDPVTIIAHSMGSQVTTWCLTQLGKAWEKANVVQLIHCAPAIAGTPVLYPCYANGPAGNCVDGDILHFPVAGIDEELARITATFPCMISQLPTNTGGIEVWPKNRVFAKTPTRSYTVGNVQDFLNDCATDGGDEDHWQIGKNIWGDFQRMTAGMRAPSVRTNIIYSGSEDCVSGCDYANDDLTKAPKFSGYEEGDQTITRASVENIANGWIKKGTPVFLYMTPEDDHVNHKGCISADWVLDLIPRLLGIDPDEQDSDSSSDAS